MTSSRILLLLSCSGLLGIAASVPACSSDDSGAAGSSSDGGTTLPTGDAATTPDAGCTKTPPTGLTQLVAPAPDGSESDTGRSAGMTLDAAGNPVIAYLDGPSSARVLMTLRWDPCAGAFTAPVQVDAIGDLDEKWSTTIATDATDGRIAIAYVKRMKIAAPNDTLATWVALSSDGGKTFTTKKISTHLVEAGKAAGDINDVDSPVVALAGGKTFVAYNQDFMACGTGGSGCRRGTVLATSTDGTTFAAEVLSDGVVTTAGGHLVARGGFHPGIATDASGAVAVVTHQEPQTGYDTAVMFCRPGKTCVKVLSSNDYQNDDGAAELAFTGTTAHVISNLQRDGTEAYDFLHATSTDGTTWATATTLPRDGDARSTATGASQLIANGTTGVVLVAETSLGSTAQYGAPKIFTSGATSWTISGATPAGATQPYGEYPTARVTSGGKLMVTFQGASPKTSTDTGVTFYLQP